MNDQYWDYSFPDATTDLSTLQQGSDVMGGSYRKKSFLGPYKTGDDEFCTEIDADLDWFR